MKFGGAMRASHEIAKGLAERGHELHLYRYKIDNKRVDLYGVPDEKANPLNFSDIATIYELIDPRPAHNKPSKLLGWKLEKTVKYVNLIQDLKYFQIRAKEDAKEIDIMNFDYIIAHLCCFTNAPLLLNYLQTPSIWYCHEPTRSLFETSELILDKNNNLLTRYYRQKRRIVELTTARKVGKVLCNSLFSREFIYRTYGIEAKICPLGVDTELFKPGNCIKKNQVICWGPLWPAKKLDFIVRSVSLIPEPIRPEVVFPWSRGSELYRKEIETLGISCNVKINLPQNLNDQQLVKYIHESKVCVYAAQMELLGLVPLEAMSAGLPVVGVKEGGVRETVLDKKTGFLCSRNEPEFAALLQRLLENDELREHMGTHAAEYIRDEWTWKITAEIIEDLIQ